MKNYDELTNDLLERRNRYVTDQKRKRKTVISVATSLCCVCLVALLGIGVWQGGMINSQSPISLDDSTVIGEKDYINPDGFDNSQSSNGENISVSGNDNSTGDSTNKDDVCDTLGMVVIDGETYLQFFTDSEAYTLDACLGDASDYEGTYRTHLNDIEAKLYTAKEDSNVLIVKLGNGGTVVLKKSNSRIRFRRFIVENYSISFSVQLAKENTTHRVVFSLVMDADSKRAALPKAR